MTLIQASSLDDLMEVVHHSSMMREGVLPVGNTTRIRRHSANPNPAHLLSLSKMNQILELNPEEQTCVVEPGVSLESLNLAAKEFNLELGVASPHAKEGTLGGLFLSGELSLAFSLYGPPRDQVLGGKWLLADGTLIQSGGQVVKNVAGYDTTRLLLGSRGRLAICLNLCLRLKPSSRHAQWGLIEPGAPTPFPTLQNIDYLFQAHPEAPTCFRADEAIFTPDMASHICAHEDGTQQLQATLNNFASNPHRYHSARACDLDVNLGPTDFLGKIQGTSSPLCPERAIAFPRKEESTWLQKIQEACAPESPPFGGPIIT